LHIRKKFAPSESSRRSGFGPFTKRRIICVLCLKKQPTNQSNPLLERIKRQLCANRRK
jgi:hypothetical protein